MPIAIRQNNGTNVLEVVASGKLSHEDYENFLPQVEEMVRKHGKIRVLVDMIDFHGWEPMAVWDDTLFAVKHFSDISRIAMVGDKEWEHLMANFCKLFTKAEVRYYDWTQLVAAKQWLAEPRREPLERVPARVGVR